MSGAHRLYDDDFYAWTQAQAQVLRASTDNRLDAEHLAEEIEDLGRSQLNRARGLLRQILAHLLKAAVNTAPDPQDDWRVELVTFHADLLDTLTPAMVHRLDLDGVWRGAVRIAETALAQHGETLPPVPADCPLVLADLTAEALSIETLVQRLRSAVGRMT